MWLLKGYNQFALLTDGDSNLGNWHGSSTNDSNTAGRSTGANIFNTASRYVQLYMLSTVWPDQFYLFPSP